MTEYLEEILDWSEVWATLIPLIVYLWIKPNASWVKPVLIYLILALLIGLVVDVTWKFGKEEWVKSTFSWLYRDKILYTLVFYNINSFIRLILFTCFFYLANPSFKKIYIIVTCLFLAGTLINFTLEFENIITDFSSRTFTVEAAIILFYCLLYFYHVNMNDEIRSPLTLPPFWIVMGLTLYTAVNFLIFLFYHYLISAERDYAIVIWNVHNIIYIVLMVFIAIAFKKTK